jgi:hypothetical protein
LPSDPPRQACQRRAARELFPHSSVRLADLGATQKPTTGIRPYRNRLNMGATCGLPCSDVAKPH